MPSAVADPGDAASAIRDEYGVDLIDGPLPVLAAFGRLGVGSFGPPPVFIVGSRTDGIRSPPTLTGFGGFTAATLRVLNDCIARV